MNDKTSSRGLLRRRPWARVLTACTGALATLAAVPTMAPAAVLPAAPGNLPAVFGSANPGDVITLAPGDYGSFAGGQKAGVVTIQGAPGGASSMEVSFGNAANINLQGLTIGAATISGGSRNITIGASRITKMSTVDASSMANAGIVFDRDTFDGIDVTASSYEGRLSVRGNNNGSPVGVAVTNSHFGNGGCSDGVQIVGGAYGVQVGPGNEFSGLKQGSCAPHVDSIQLYGSSHTQIVGNYFHDDDTIIMAPDGGESEVIADNVMVGAGYVPAVQLGSHRGSQFVHNTVKNIDVHMDHKSGQSPSSGGVVRDNVFVNGTTNASDPGNCSGCTVTSNLFTTSGAASGTNAVVGTPIFVGGANPSTYDGYQLASTSPGRGNATDGDDLGARVAGSTPPPPDGTAPETTITSGPTGTTNDSTPTFAFSASEADAVFECRVDSGSWVDCQSPWTPPVLGNGAHSVAVRATDEAGNTDASPATRSFTVATAPPPDTTAPDTTITEGPTATTDDESPTFAFTASEPNSVFECRVDATPWGNCASPWTAAALSDGPHTVSVRATDAAGNTDASPATRSFTVATAPPSDTTPPDTTITSGPTGTTDDATPTFAFASEAGAVFECRVDSGSWAECASPWTTAALSGGDHTVSVRATDAAGNTDASPATRSFTVAAPPGGDDEPVAAFTYSPAAPAVGQPVSFDASTTTCDDAPCTYTWADDGADGAGGTQWPLGNGRTLSFTFQGEGVKRVRVTVTDVDGDSDSTMKSVTVGAAPPSDATPPETTISSGPSGTTSATSASFEFASSKPGSTFECRLDAAAYAACISPKDYSELSAGSHTFNVRAEDAAGNVDASPASRSWTIQAAPPGGDDEPVAAFTYSPAAPAVGQPVSFDASTTTCDDAPCTYTWADDGTDGAGGTQWPLGNGRTLSFTFQGEGVKRVRVTVTDVDGDSDSTMKSVTVGSPAPPDTPPADDTAAPDTTIESGPDPVTNDNTPTFVLAATEIGSTFSCQVDAGQAAACTSPWTTSPLADGSHRVEVAATDPAGNADVSPATRSFRVDTQPPETTIESAPPAYSSESSATLTFDANEPEVSFECRLDWRAWADCTSPKTYAGLAVGRHWASVRATDAAGNVDASPDWARWTTVAP